MDKTNNLKKLIVLLVFGLIFATLTTVIYINYINEKSKDGVIKDTKLPHNLIKNQINTYKDKQYQMIKMLAEHRLMLNYLDAKDWASEFELSEFFHSIVKANTSYMQLRLIDLNGKELIRVDQDKNKNIKIIKNEKLQNKFNRDYFQNFLKLDNDEIGFSHFDLNMENEKVEVPFNPTLRIAYKVFVDNKPKALVVINLYMQEWINNLLKINHFKVSIIDENNYFKTHYEKKWEWSFYQDSSKKISQYPFFENIPNWQDSNNEYFLLADNSIGRKLNLFNEEVLVVYKIPKDLKTIISKNILPLLLTIAIASFFILLPIALIILQLIKNIKKSELYQRSILDNMFDAMIVIDKKAEILSVNKQAESLFGYMSHELLGKNVNLLIPQPHHDKHDDYVKNYKKEGRTIIGNNRELKALCKDKSTVPVSLAITKMHIDNLELFIGIARDLREIKELEEINRQQKELLFHQAKLASMGEMIGAIAHQWRQPLNALGLNIQNLKYDYLDGEVNEEFIKGFVDENKKTINFMSKTIDDFRNFFRIDKAKVNFKVKESIQSVIDMQFAQLKEKNIFIGLEGDEFIYNGFKSEFQQVVLILLNNAKDALLENNTKNPTININLENKIITVKDNAGGIPTNIINRIFEPYFTTKEEGKGTGMGLYLAKTIIENNMGARLIVENENDGAVFKIIFEEET